MKPLHRYIPELALYKIENQLVTDEPLFRYEKEVFFFIVDLFYRLKVYNKNIKYTKDGLVRISSKYYSAYITKGYANYIRWLEKHEILVCDRIKKKGKSFGYELHPAIQSKIVKVKIPGDKKITHRIIENFNKKQKNHKKTDDHLKTMKAYFKMKMKVNLDSALEWLEFELKKKTITMSQFNVYYLSLLLISDKELFFKRNTTNGRVDSNLTNLKSELRQFIDGDWRQIDCKNSQPLIINYLINYITINNIQYIEYKENSSSPTPHYPLTPSLGEDYEKILRKQLNDRDMEYLKVFPRFDEGVLLEFNDFKKTTFDGTFYNLLQQKYESLYQKPISRDDVKEIVYKVFFSRNHAYGKEKRVFKALYPTIYEIIFQLKKEKHNKFALCLQTIESEIFIDRISKRLVENGIIPLTIHDSIVVLDHEKDRALEIVKSVYQELMQGEPNFECEVL